MNTIFLRLLEAADKAAALRAAARRAPEAEAARFVLDPARFGVIPRSPFAYWVTERMRRVFQTAPRFKTNYFSVRGAYTNKDFRFYRLAWEYPPSRTANERATTLAGRSMVRLAKGGAFSPFYADVHLAVRWDADGREAKAFLSSYRERKGWGTDWSACLNGYEHYFRPGLTWPRRTDGLSMRALPRGCIFADKGPAAFTATDDSIDLLALLAITNSRAFRALVALQLARTKLAQSYEVGLIQNTPVPQLNEETRAKLASLARAIWSCARARDTHVETSHAFALPGLLQVDGSDLHVRSTRWRDRVAKIRNDIESTQAEIDARIFALYGVDENDCAVAPVSVIDDDGDDDEDGDDDDDGDEEENDPADDDLGGARESLVVLAEEFVSWGVGVSMGRFDVRLASGDRALPIEPAPFDALPSCSPGMLTGDDGQPLTASPPSYPIAVPANGILTDDDGDTRDILTSLRRVLDCVFGAESEVRWAELAEILDPKERSLRGWLARELFDFHRKRYSKSRRQAPIYWQLGTASGRYSVWLYAHRLTSDSFFRLQDDIVARKLAHEEAGLARLRTNAGERPSVSSREACEAQESLVEELRAMLDEVRRVAPLWSPNLDDGVVLTMAPLWRLVPQHKAWQSELREKWAELIDGEYDWAHVAMHLWPERVVPKCADDRSLAIAHGLESAFWTEDSDGDWRKREIDRARIESLVAERTSPAVKAALASLLAAPTAKGTPTKKRGRAARSRPSPLPAASTTVASDEATIAAVRASITGMAYGGSKNDVVEATGISTRAWNAAITALLERGEVTQSGQKRGARYHSVTITTSERTSS